MAESITIQIDLLASAVASILTADPKISADLRERVSKQLQLVTAKDAAKLLSVSESTFFRSIARKMRAVRFDGTVRYRLKDIEELIDSITS